MNEYRIGKMVCHNCGAEDGYVTDDGWFVKLKQRCQKCGSGLTTWTPHTVIVGDKSMAADTGEQGTKHDADKLRYDLLPSALAEVAYVYTQGAKKYEDRNWEKGLKWGRVFRALIQHAWAWWWGEQKHENNMHHLASVAWCALALMEYEKTHPELDDRPYGEKNANSREGTGS